MISISLSNQDIFKILGSEVNEIYYGGNQEWYTTEWQRCAGCGPTTASNIVLYLKCIQQSMESKKDFISKTDYLLLMEEVWEYVTPTKRGIPETKMFYDAVLSYAKSKGVSIKYASLDLPKEKELCPEFSEVLSFLEVALLKDVPVAFLNLNNGEEKNLEAWHWVTIIGLEYEEDKSTAFINILDEGIIKKIDLALWYNTTTEYGGFVYFY